MRKLINSIALSLSLFTLVSCGPSLEERVKVANTPELLMDAGTDVLESIDDQESLDQGKVFIVQLYHNYQALDDKQKQKIQRQFLRENKEINAEVERILQLDLEIGSFTEPVIDRNVKYVLRTLKEMNKPIRIK